MKMQVFTLNGNLNLAVKSKSTLSRFELFISDCVHLILLFVSVRPASIELSQLFWVLANSKFPSMFHSGHFVEVTALNE